MKHGCRTLPEKGKQGCAGYLWFADAGCVKVTGFALEDEWVAIGKSGFFLYSRGKKAARIRLEYRD